MRRGGALGRRSVVVVWTDQGERRGWGNRSGVGASWASGARPCREASDPSLAQRLACNTCRVLCRSLYFVPFSDMYCGTRLLCGCLVAANLFRAWALLLDCSFAMFNAPASLVALTTGGTQRRKGSGARRVGPGHNPSGKPKRGHWPGLPHCNYTLARTVFSAAAAAWPRVVGPLSSAEFISHTLMQNHVKWIPGSCVHKAVLSIEAAYFRRPLPQVIPRCTALARTALTPLPTGSPICTPSRRCTAREDADKGPVLSSRRLGPL